MQLDPTLVEDVRAWLDKGGVDVHACRAMIHSGFSNLEGAIGNHLQQALEKVLKAYLTYNDHSFAKTHDLDDLAELCVKLDPSLATILHSLGDLTPFATIYRYPNTTSIDMSFETAKYYIGITEHIIHAIIERLPNEISTGMQLLTDPIIPNTK